MFLQLLLFLVFSNPPPESAIDFDIQRYQGLWHQMAAIPMSFQKDCYQNTSAEYELLDNGYMKVINRCETKEGSISDAEARARVNPDYDKKSKLEVTFVKFFGWIWLFSGDYWVLYVDENYETAIVGSPEREYGWILSKNAKLSKKEFKKLAKILNQKGYDTCRFIMSSTNKQEFSNNVRLCDYVESSI